MPSTTVLKRDGVRLAVTDFGGAGPGVLFLHGLAGHGGEWAATASALGAGARCVAFDARGHGASERRPCDVSRAAHVADARAVIDMTGIAPAVLVGQSIGALTALLLADHHPELARGVVMVEGSPDAGGPGSDAHVERSLRSWPVPFPARADAIAYFAGRGFPPEPWADGLEPRADGLWPRFDVDVLVATVREADSRTYWGEWERINRPRLVVRGARGTLSADVARRMAGPEVVELDAGHDVHLDRPHEMAGALRAFLARC